METIWNSEIIKEGLKELASGISAAGFWIGAGIALAGIFIGGGMS